MTTSSCIQSDITTSWVQSSFSSSHWPQSQCHLQKQSFSADSPSTLKLNRGPITLITDKSWLVFFFTFRSLHSLFSHRFPCFWLALHGCSSFKSSPTEPMTSPQPLPIRQFPILPSTSRPVLARTMPITYSTPSPPSLSK